LILEISEQIKVIVRHSRDNFILNIEIQIIRKRWFRGSQEIKQRSSGLRKCSA